MPPTDTRDQLKALFGSPTRVLLLAWAREHGRPFFQSQPPREVGPPTQVRAELERLTALGMFASREDVEERRTYYEVVDGPLWRVVTAAADAFGLKQTRARPRRTRRAK